MLRFPRSPRGGLGHRVVYEINGGRSLTNVREIK